MPQALRSVPGVQYLAAGVNSRAQLIAGNQNWSSQIQGTDVELPLIRNWPTKYGSFFTAQDVATAQKVCVLGQTVSDNLFGPDVDPTGQIIRVKNQPFKVLGVMAPKGIDRLRAGSGRCGVRAVHDRPEEAPGHSAHQQHHGVGRDAGNGAGVGGASPTTLRTRHKLMGSDPDDFMVRTQEEMASVRTETTKTMTTLLAAIAGVSLLVGGIGIMNIMLVSVTERTREIGLRMAIGARGKDVLMQFLVEAVVLSLFGGLLGHRHGLRAVGGGGEVPEVADLDSRRTPSGWRSALRRQLGYFSGFIRPRKRLGLTRSKRFGSNRIRRSADGRRPCRAGMQRRRSSSRSRSRSFSFQRSNA